ncbi:MAG: class I SAM-dependent methyltransferase [Pseudomonadota bacterium]
MIQRRHSDDYHDYVFKDGRLVGDFEGMYRNSADVPWHQDISAFDVISDIDIAILKREAFDRICDVGCGLGHFTARLKNELSGKSDSLPGEVIGLDVSPKAVEDASALHSNCEFQVADILSDDFVDVPGQFDLVVCRGVLWYVVQDLEKVLSRLAQLGKECGKILVTLSFPPSKTWVGQGILGSPEDLKTRLSEIMVISHWCVEYDDRHGSVPLCHAYGTLCSDKGVE